jgi:endo-1,4-beta-xylanase
MLKQWIGFGLVAAIALGASAARAQAVLPPLPAALLAAAPAPVLPSNLGATFKFVDTINHQDAPGSFRLAGERDGQVSFRADTPKGSSDGNGIRAVWSTTQKVRKGDVLLARFAARAIKARQESGEAEGMFTFQRTSVPSERFAQAISVGPEWTVINAGFVALDDAAPGDAAAAFSFGNLEQTLEIAGLELWNFSDRVKVSALPITRFSYKGREADATWRKEALARIDALRTSLVTVKVVDASGKLVAGATVDVRMQRPEFLWGSSVSAERITAEGADADRYRQQVIRLFDTTVIENGLKWPRWREPAYRQRALTSLDWLLAQDKRVKGHNLVWPAWKFSPKDIVQDPARGSKIRGLVDAHVREITAATKGKLIGWDVVNEPIHETDYFKHMPREAVAHWFKLAQQSDPKLQLTVNEYAMLNRSSSPLFIADFLEYVRMLRQQGARVDVLGVQGHVGQTPRPPVAVLADLDLLAVDGNKVQVTEFDFNTPDEQLQADYTRDFLISLYSHKAVTGFIMWGFWESEHWKPNAAMFRSDWSEKPNLKVWQDLVLGAWNTRASGPTAANGEMTAKGHHGRYTASASVNGKTVEAGFDLTPGGTTVLLKL